MENIMQYYSLKYPELYENEELCLEQTSGKWLLVVPKSRLHTLDYKTKDGT